LQLKLLIAKYERCYIFPFNRKEAFSKQGKVGAFSASPQASLQKIDKKAYGFKAG
jgi:hypothetical protein